MATIEAKLHQVHARVAQACATAGRPVRSVTLLAVSKTHRPAAVREAVAAGQREFGENYVGEAIDKMQALAELRSQLRWHLIGPLQANKTRDVAMAFDWVHTIDRLKIAQRLSEQRAPHLPPLNVCMQVNVSGEARKSGVAPDDLLPLARAVAGLPRLRLRGLMSVPEPSLDFAAQRRPHRALRALFDALNAQGFALDTLSMGMSADLEAAIVEGATVVRIGSAIFGARPAAAVSGPCASTGA